MICSICPRKCNVDRAISRGYCHSSETMRIAYVGLHHGEEPLISGTLGSGTIFFSGCNLACVYCQNYNVSSRCLGNDYSQDKFISAIKTLEDKGAHNINLVTANHYIPQIMRALDKYCPSIPICYNTSSYDSLDTLINFNPYVDIYLADLKYIDNSLSKTLSKAENYPKVATNALQFMRKKADIIQDGLMLSGLIIRHLILPKHFNNTLQTLNWIQSNLPNYTHISIMSQYTPSGNLQDSPELSTPITQLENKLVLSKLQKLGFENVLIQELDSSGEEFIPTFSGKCLF